MPRGRRDRGANRRPLAADRWCGHACRRSRRCPGEAAAARGSKLSRPPRRQFFPPSRSLPCRPRPRSIDRPIRSRRRNSGAPNRSTGRGGARLARADARCCGSQIVTKALTDRVNHQVTLSYCFDGLNLLKSRVSVLSQFSDILFARGSEILSMSAAACVEPLMHVARQRSRSARPCATTPICRNPLKACSCWRRPRRFR